MATTFDDVDFGAADFNDGLDLEPKLERVGPPIDTSLSDQDIYPPDARSPLFMDWTPEEEDHQSAALSWFLWWRKTNPFRIVANTGMWTLPPEDIHIWESLKDRMIDWAFLERGGLDLEKTHDLLIRRSNIRLARRPIRYAKDLPTGAGIPKEPRYVRKPQQGDPHRKPGERPRTQGHPERNGCRPLLDRND